MVSILGANSASGGYEVENSLRFNDGDSPRLTRTPSSAGNRRTFTLSVWFKLTVSPSGDSNYERQILAADDGTGGNNNFDYIAINNLNKIFLYNYEGGEAYVFTSTQLLRDPSAWYHLVVAFDTTQGTNTNRVKIYLNGNQITDFDTANYPSQNHQTRFNNSNAHRIGSYPDQDTQYFDGYMCEYHLVDGSQLAPTSFGEFNDNGVWVPIKYTGSHGTNGFYLEFKQTGTSANSSGIGADTSGNDNHWAVTNLAALDVTEDTCTNNFATFNPLFRSRFDNDGTFLEGNCQRDFTDNANRGYGMSTLGVTSGKWYWEIKVIGSDVSRIGIGVGYDGLSAFTDPFYDNNPSLGMHFYSSGSVSANGSTQSYGSSSNANDIFMYALDMDNHLIWLGKNGSWFNSATVTEIQNSTATNDITTKLSSQTFLNSGEPVFPMVNDLSTTGASQFQINFGNPPFSISSGNNDGKYGNFEYAVPSGYYALCTKRLAEFG